jgi:hypothetical protein
MSQSTAQDLQPTSVYRYYDSLGCLIYVGITKQGIGRNHQHNGSAEWWPHVARQEVEHFESRKLAARREKELIFEFRPPFNKVHNPNWRQQQAAYLVTRQELPRDAGWGDAWAALDRRLPLVLANRLDSLVEFVSDPRATVVAQTVSTAKRQVIQVIVDGQGAVVGRVQRLQVLAGHLWITASIRKDIEIEQQAYGYLVMKPWTPADKCSIKSLRVVTR